nr:hypothetical protein [Butyrivibrio sp. AE3009]
MEDIVLRICVEGSFELVYKQLDALDSIAGSGTADVSDRQFIFKDYISFIIIPDMYHNRITKLLEAHIYEAFVGIVATAICSNMTVTYALGNLGTIIALGCSGIVLAVLAVVLPNKFGNHDILGTISVLGAIALFTTAFGKILSERILLIAGLFSYDSVNTVGWQVFSVTVVAFAGFIVGALVLIIGAFTRSVKENA